LAACKAFEGALAARLHTRPLPLQGRRRAAETARLERIISQRRAAREAAWAAHRVPVPLHRLLAAALGCAVPPPPDPTTLPKRPPSAGAPSSLASVVVLDV
jgi:hypothetical protein